MTDKTSDLMNKLMSTDTPDELGQYLKYIKDKYPGNLKSYLEAVLEEKGKSKADVQKASGINRTYFYQIMDGSRSPSRDRIIAIAIACQMTLPECQRALEIAKEGILYPKSRRDSLIIYAINKRLSILDLNCYLQENDLPILDLEKNK